MDDHIGLNPDSLLPEDVLAKWTERTDLHLRMSRHRAGTDAAADSTFADLVSTYRDLETRRVVGEESRARIQIPGVPGTIFGCEPTLTRPYSVRHLRSVYPHRPGATGTIDEMGVNRAQGRLEFSARVTNSADPGPGDYSVWMRQWMFVYLFPSSALPAKVHYEFRMWPNVTWFTETGGRRVQIFLHLGIRHIHDLNAPSGDIDEEFWPVTIDTDEDGRFGFPSGSTITVTGEFNARPDATPALMLIPGVFVLAPNGLVRIPYGHFWVSQQFPTDTTDESQWGWLKYCIRDLPVIADT